MRQFVTFLLFLLAPALAAKATDDQPCFDELMQKHKVSIYRGPIAKKIDFSLLPASRHFRTSIHNALKNGVNFAGHYAVVEWACGTGCIGMAIVDVASGMVVFFVPALLYSNLDPKRENVTIPCCAYLRADSTVLVVNALCDPLMIKEKLHASYDPTGPLAYVWNSTQFVPIDIAGQAP